MSIIFDSCEKKKKKIVLAAMIHYHSCNQYNIIVSIGCRLYERDHVIRREPYRKSNEILNKDLFLKVNFLNKLIAEFYHFGVETRYFVKSVLVKLYVTNKKQYRVQLF